MTALLAAAIASEAASLPSVPPLLLAPGIDVVGSSAFGFLPGVTLVALGSALVEFLQPVNLLDVFLNGLAKSALYIMIAVGLTLIFGLMGVLNFAHGSFTMIGAYLGGLILVLTVMVRRVVSPASACFSSAFSSCSGCSRSWEASLRSV